MTTETPYSVKNRADGDWITRLRRYIHSRPETAGNEERTARFIAKKLEQLGMREIRTGIAGHGLIALLGPKSEGPVVALRADMDALPVEEQTDVSFTSQHPGVMHACGHDAHMAILLGATRILKEMEDCLPGRVLLLFQPAEENSPTGGAQPMIEEGALTDPRPDAIFGLHVWPDLPVGQIGVKPDFQMGASDRFEIHIHGQGGHASMPHRTIDASLIAVQVAQCLQTVVSRNVNPLETAVLSITSIQAGENHNVIPGYARLTGSVRTLKSEIRNLMENRLREVAIDVTRAMGAEAKVHYERGYQVLHNDPAMVETVKTTARDLLGDTSLPLIEPALAAEDFSAYLKEVPGAFFWLGCGFSEESKNFSLHHPRFLVDERALPLGAEMMAGTAIRFLREKAHG
ncbi:M20 metallopeptidase family protein [Salinithrix halophila]|uniref:M20 family metallopeptidase n=1 Tax=Salinithrix halophila TaxID=1485204 RepID=A0ABV8JF60_9BACL